MKSAFYQGRVFHRRRIPRSHGFSYRFFMWFLNLDELDRVPDLAPWFSCRRFALSRFRRADYLGPPEEPLHVSVKKKMAELTGIPVTGPVCGLMNLRTLGLYFSPVNFYFGYDRQGEVPVLRRTGLSGQALQLTGYQITYLTELLECLFFSTTGE